MPKGTPQQSKGRRGKNIKNIYVHKINSLMKISRDNLHEEDLEMVQKLEKSKMKRIHSEGTIKIDSVDKGTMKLQKNRQSARKARQRKKLYIKLLENQVDQLKAVSKVGQQIEQQGRQYYEKLNKKLEKSYYQTQISHVDKYLSQSDLGQNRQSANSEIKDRMMKMDKYTEQICQMYIPPFLRNIQNIRQNSNFLNQIMLRQDQSKKNQQQLVQLVGQLFDEHQMMRRKFGQLMRINQTAKKHLKSVLEQSRQQFFDSDFGFEQNNVVLPQGNVKDFIKQQSLAEIKRNYSQMQENIVNKRNRNSIFVNVNQAENLITKIQKFMEQAKNKSQY